MRGPRIALGVAALAAVPLAGVPAFGYVRDQSFAGDLDGDPGVEQIRTVRLPVRGGPDRTGVNVRDSCRAGRVDVPVAGPQENLARLVLARADTRPGRELFVDLRSGTRRRGEVRLVGWRRASEPTCRKPRQLFRYAVRGRRRGAAGLARFSISLRDRTRRFGGKEIELLERFARANESFACASVKRRSRYRYSRPRDRYVRYLRRTARSVPRGCRR